MVCFNEDFCKYVMRDHALCELSARVGSERTREYTIAYFNEYIRTARKAGYLVAYNHPYWSMHPYEEIEALEGLFSLEIANYGSYLASGLEYCGALYDRLLRKGRHIFCHAADDNHNDFPPEHPHCDSFGCYTMILPETFTYDGIIRAMETGDMYAPWDRDSARCPSRTAVFMWSARTCDPSSSTTEAKSRALCTQRRAIH